MFGKVFCAMNEAPLQISKKVMLNILLYFTPKVIGSAFKVVGNTPRNFGSSLNTVIVLSLLFKFMDDYIGETLYCSPHRGNSSKLKGITIGGLKNALNKVSAGGIISEIDKISHYTVT